MLNIAFEIFVQLLGGLGILCSFISFQCKNHNKILFFRTMNELLFGIQYFFLGAYTGMAMNFVGCVRNVIFSNRVAKGKKTGPFIALFSVLFTIFGVVTWQGPKSILIIVAKVLSTVAYGNKNTTVVRSIVLVTSSSWLVYNVFAGSIAGVICEVLTVFSIVSALIRLDLMPALKKGNEENRILEND